MVFSSRMNFIDKMAFNVVLQLVGFIMMNRNHTRVSLYVCFNSTPPTLMPAWWPFAKSETYLTIRFTNLELNQRVIVDSNNVVVFVRNLLSYRLLIQWQTIDVKLINPIEKQTNGGFCWIWNLLIIELRFRTPLICRFSCRIPIRFDPISVQSKNCLLISTYTWVWASIQKWNCCFVDF